MVALRWLARVAVPGVLSGCMAADSAEADDFYMDDDVPAGNCMTGTGCATDEGDGASSGGGEVEGTCESTLQCDVGQMCIATFDGDIGEFECSSTCIMDMQEDRWCLDDDACCEVGSICSPRGYCMPGEGTTTAEETGGDETGVETADETGTDTTTSDTGDASTSDETTSTGTSG